MLETDDLTILTDQELAAWHMVALEAEPKYRLLAENEWKMRALRVQKDFNDETVKKQMKLTKWGIILGAVVAIVGAIIGAILTATLPRMLSVGSPPSPQVSSTHSFPKTTAVPATPSLKQEARQGSDKLGTKKASILSKLPR